MYASWARLCAAERWRQNEEGFTLEKWHTPFPLD